MDAYLQRARAALDAFDAARAAVAQRLDGPSAPGTFAGGTLRTLRDVDERLVRATAALSTSFSHLDRTALDVVDLQTRLEGECAALASGLRQLGDIATRQPSVAHALEDELVALEEAAGQVAAATFPGAVEGLDDVNRSLWDFRGLVWTAYERKLSQVVAGRKLTTAQIQRVEDTARLVRERFEAVDTLLDALITARFQDANTCRSLVADARRNLAAALVHARSKAEDDYRPFHAVLGQVQKLATRVDSQLARCRIPIFPPAAQLDAARELIDAEAYAALPGVSRFALLNITAGLCAIAVPGGSGHLLASGFVRKAFQVLPDRVYLEATPDFLTAVDALTRNGTFVPASAHLHRFRDGSVKQRTNRRGNVQLSYARDGDIVRVDADIDLYRSPTRHLFGEVLMNHITGRTTDQFRVRAMLDARGVRPVGGFEILTP